MFGIPVQLIFWGIVGVVAAAALGVLHHSIYSQGEQAGIAAQVKADTVIVKRLTAERDEARAAEQTREAENRACAATVAQQNGALETLSRAGQAARAQSAAILARLSASSKDTTALLARLHANAAAAPTGDRNAQCANADAIATDALRRMREQP